MGREIESQFGKMILSEEAISTIAGIAATECYGVVGMAARRVTDGLIELLGRDNLSKGVEVVIDGDSVSINLYIIVGYGVRIPEVARNVMEKVKYTVENTTSLKVRKIRINVVGIRTKN